MDLYWEYEWNILMPNIDMLSSTFSSQTSDSLVSNFFSTVLREMIFLRMGMVVLVLIINQIYYKSALCPDCLLNI